MESGASSIPIVADSRRGLRAYPSCIFKMNAAELASPTSKPADSSISEIQRIAAELARKNGRTVFVTMAERGLVGAMASGEVEHVPSIPLRGPIDVVGAGDSVTANSIRRLPLGPLCTRRWNRLPWRHRLSFTNWDIRCRGAGTNGWAAEDNARQQNLGGTGGLLVASGGSPEVRCNCAALIGASRLSADESEPMLRHDSARSARILPAAAGKHGRPWPFHPGRKRNSVQFLLRSFGDCVVVQALTHSIPAPGTCRP